MCFLIRSRSEIHYGYIMHYALHAYVCTLNNVKGRGHWPRGVTWSLSALSAAAGWLVLPNTFTHIQIPGVHWKNRHMPFGEAQCCAVVYGVWWTQYGYASLQFITMNWTAGCWGRCWAFCFVWCGLWHLFWICSFQPNAMSSKSGSKLFLWRLQKDPRGPTGKDSNHVLLTRVAFVYI